MAVYIIADLHLSVDTSQRVALLGQFLGQIQSDAEALYVLGDFFEVWLGDDAIPDALQPLLDQFRALSQKFPVYFQAGNRDFLIGERFAELSGMVLLPEQAIVDFYDHKVLLMHGDLLCTDDHAYMAFRNQVRNPDWIASFLNLDINQRVAMAKQARAQSQQENTLKSEEIMDANPDTIEAYMQDSGVQYLIHGHTHRPAIHQSESEPGPKTRAVVGDWHDQPSYIRLSKNEIRLVDPRIDPSQSVKSW